MSVLLISNETLETIRLAQRETDSFEDCKPGFTISRNLNKSELFCSMNPRTVLMLT